MKKFILIASILLLGACSSKKVDNEDYTYILFATPLKEHTIWLQAKEGFDTACDENNIKCDWIGPNVIDTQNMNDVIETGIMQKADAIITQGVVEESLVNLAYEQNIPVILVDSDMPNSKRFLYMGKDFNLQANLLLEDIEKKYGKDKKLKIAIQVAEESFSIAQDQIKELENVFASHKGGFEIVSVSESKSDIIRAKKEWGIVLSENPDINVAINFAAESAEPCSEAAIEKSIREDMLIYGVDDMETTLNLIREHKIDGTLATSFYDYGYKSVNILLDYLNKSIEPNNRILSPKLIIVNEENIDTYDK